MKTGIELIAEERERQINQEGWTPEHDATRRYGELAYAAMGYANLAAIQSDAIQLGGEPKDMHPHPQWPFDDSWWKPSNDAIKNLKRAGALIAAEIDRLQRLKIIARLEHLRGELRAERISMDELAELQSLAKYIQPGDVELLEAAGVPESGTD